MLSMKGGSSKLSMKNTFRKILSLFSILSVTLLFILFPAKPVNDGEANPREMIEIVREADTDDYFFRCLAQTFGQEFQENRKNISSGRELFPFKDIHLIYNIIHAACSDEHGKETSRIVCCLAVIVYLLLQI